MTTDLLSPFRSLPDQPNADHLKKQAKDLLRAYRKGDSAAIQLINYHERNPTTCTLLDAQRVLARSYGFSSWPRLKSFLAASRYDSKAEQAIAAFGPAKKLLNEGRGQETWALICAAIRNDTDALQALLDEDPSRAQLEIWYTFPIHFAVREGHLAATTLLWEANPCEGVADLITMAEDRRYTDIAAYLRDAPRPNIFHADSDQAGRTSLHHAVLANDLQEVERCLQAGDDMEATDDHGFRPIHYAHWCNPFWTCRDHPEISNALRQAGCKDSITLAAARGDIDRVRLYLLDNPQCVDDGDTLDKRALSAAAERGHDNIVALLLEYGAQTNIREGRMAPKGSALMGASVRGDVAMAKRLLDHGADPNADIDSSGTPSSRASSPAMQELLFAAGGRPLGIWPLIQQGQWDSVQTILRHDPDPFSSENAEYASTPYTAIISGCARASDQQETEVYWTLLQFFLDRGVPLPPCLTACRNYLFHVPAMTRVLLEHGLDPDLPDWLNRRPLHSICEDYRHFSDDLRLELITMLLEHGADINAIESDSQSTPLGIAAKCNRVDCAAALLDAGADANAAGAAWARPLAWAQRRNHQHMLTLLRQRGAQL